MKSIYITISITLALVVSCAKGPAPGGTRTGLALDIAPVVSQSTETRAAVFGSYDSATGTYRLPNRTTYGLYICVHHTGSYTDGSNPYEEYAPLYNNIRAYRNEYGVWSYKYTDPNNSNAFPTLFIFPMDEDNNGVTDKTADIFAYSPYLETGTLEAIPFSITGATDVMYAAENGVSNLDIDAANDADPRITAGHLDVPLTFKHALSLLEFDIKLKADEINHPGGDGSTDRTANSYTLESIRLDRREGGHPLYVSGSMNAMKGGELTALVAAESVTVSGATLRPHYVDHLTPPVSVSPGSTSKAYILQVPSQTGETYSDGDYTFTFRFSGQTFPSTFTLLREHIRHADGTTYGFQPGYRYTFHFTIDNYIHFEGLTIGEWETVTEPLYQTEI